MAPLLDFETPFDEYGFERPIVLCHGTFDLVHPGHLDHLLEAKRHGRTLICGVTSDRWVRKGPGKPIFSSQDRAYHLRSLGLVDGVFIVDNGSAIPLIEAVRPDVYVKGPDYGRGEDTAGNLRDEIVATELLGGRVHFTHGRKLSSSELHKDLGPINSQFVYEYRRDLQSALKKLQKSLRGKTVTVVGEPIWDEYVSCRPLGKTSKSALLAFHELSTRRMMGGSMAFARNLASLGVAVNLVHDSMIETSDPEAKNVLKSMNLISLAKHKPREIVKKRWVESDSGNHVFEAYDFDDARRAASEAIEKSDVLLRAFEQSDAVAFLDFGHGLLWRETLSLLRELLPDGILTFANVQKNAGNEGHNPVSKYSWVDHLIMNGSEFDSIVRQTGRTLQELEQEVHEVCGVESIFVTQGKNGFVHYGLDKKTTVVSSVAAPIKGDRTGAGDAAYAGVVALGLCGLLEDSVSLELVNLFGQVPLSGFGNEYSISFPAISALIEEVTSLKTDPLPPR